ncbi:MAG: hypothetical protein ACR2QQ_13630, partial [Gammaproteobacteria bacterium]
DCENQAFRVGDCVYGLQFHLEADRALIERWLKTPVHMRELARLEGAIDPKVIIEDTTHYMARAMQLSQEFFGEFIERFYSRRRRVALPSR